MRCNFHLCNAILFSLSFILSNFPGISRELLRSFISPGSVFPVICCQRLFRSDYTKFITTIVLVKLEIFFFFVCNTTIQSKSKCPLFCTYLIFIALFSRSQHSQSKSEEHPCFSNQLSGRRVKWTIVIVILSAIKLFSTIALLIILIRRKKT